MVFCTSEHDYLTKIVLFVFGMVLDMMRLVTPKIYTTQARVESKVNSLTNKAITVDCLKEMREYKSISNMHSRTSFFLYFFLKRKQSR